jgi:putative spermidine/putrescine transport system ATP-binding protein
MSPKSTGAALTVDSVSKYYKDSAAVDNVSFSLDAGTFLTMLGPSGSGKTTTLNMIAGFSLPDTGSITVGGKDITRIPPHRRGIGVVFQNYALFPHMTVEQNVAFPLEMEGMRRREALGKARKALDMVELGARAKHYPRQLSGGQQQRVALARAVVFEPPLLLMDEPLGALDKRLRIQMQIEIMRISRNLGSTVVYVTHDQEEALVMSDLIAVYNSGRIEQMGTSRELYEEPRTLFVADFIGESVRLSCSLQGGALLRGHGWSGRTPSRNWAGSAENAVLVIRPEDLNIETLVGGYGGAENSVSGTVQDVIYVGPALIYLVGIPGGQEIEVRAPRTAATGAIAQGSQVRVSWDPERTVLVSESAALQRTVDEDRIPESVQ